MKSKKTLLLLLVLGVLLVSAVFYFMSVQNGGGSPITAIRNLLPFGNNNIPSGGFGSPTQDATTTYQAPVINTDTDAPAPIFRKITAGPVSGFTIFNRQRTEIQSGKKVTINETPIRYVTRSNGNVYETLSTSTKTIRLTNTTLPRIQEAFFTNNGGSVVLRSLDEIDSIKTYLANIILPAQSSASTTDLTGTQSDSDVGSLQGFYIKDNVSFVEVSPDTKNILLAFEDVSGTDMQIIDTKGGGGKSIYNSQLGEWLPQWYAAGSIALTSKPSSGVPGIALSEDIKSKNINTLLSNVPGVTSLVNTNGSKVLFDQAENQGFALGYIDTKTGIKMQVERPTLPEKCVWSKKKTDTAYCLIPNITNPGSYPDDWYQGLVSFTDSIWALDTTKNAVTLIYDPNKTSSVAIDGIRPALSPDEDYLVFMNKKDGSLWSLRLSN